MKRIVNIIIIKTLLQFITATDEPSDYRGQSYQKTIDLKEAANRATQEPMLTRCKQGHNSLRFSIWFRVSQMPSLGTRATIVSLEKDIKLQVHKENGELFFNYWDKYSGFLPPYLIASLRTWVILSLEVGRDRVRITFQSEDSIGIDLTSETLDLSKEPLLTLRQPDGIVWLFGQETVPSAGTRPK